MDKVDSVSLLCSPLGIQTDVGSNFFPLLFHFHQEAF